LIIERWWKVKGARWPSFALNLADSGGAMKGSRIKMKMSFAGYGIRNMGYGEEMKIKIRMK